MNFLILYHIKLEITLITCNLALLCSELLLNDLSTSSCNQTNYIITKQCVTKSVLFGVLIISSYWILFLHNDELQRHCNCSYTIVLIHVLYVSKLVLHLTSMFDFKDLQYSQLTSALFIATLNMKKKLIHSPSSTHN